MRRQLTTCEIKSDWEINGSNYGTSMKKIIPRNSMERKIHRDSEIKSIQVDILY